MNFATKLYEVLYVSTIAPNEAVSIVAEIAGKARLFNSEHDITGLLIFDGMRFCQQLEGSSKQVLALMERITQDPRQEPGHPDYRARRRYLASLQTLDLLCLFMNGYPPWKS